MRGEVGEGAVCNLYFFAQKRTLGALLLHGEHSGVWASFALGALGGGEREDQGKGCQSS